MKKNFRKALAVLGVPVAFAGCTTTTDNLNTPVATGEVVNTEALSEVSSYKSGNYDSVGTYKSPAGDEELGVHVTLENNIVTDASVDVKATHEVSKKFQLDFSGNIKASVVGKNINDLQVSKVSGASLTPLGFNEALEKIKGQAKS